MPAISFVASLLCSESVPFLHAGSLLDADAAYRLHGRRQSQGMQFGGIQTIFVPGGARSSHLPPFISMALGGMRGGSMCRAPSLRGQSCELHAPAPVSVMGSSHLTSSSPSVPTHPFHTGFSSLLTQSCSLKPSATRWSPTRRRLSSPRARGCACAM